MVPESNDEDLNNEAADKESFKKSLLQVDKFLDEVGQSIQSERNLIRNLAKKQSISTDAQKYGTGTTTDEVFDALFSDVDILKESTPIRETKSYAQTNFKTENDNLNVEAQILKRHPHFMRAIAALKDKGMNTGSTVKLSLAVSDLKKLVKHDIDVKSERNAAQAAEEILRQVKDKLNGHKDANKTETKQLQRKHGGNDTVTLDVGTRKDQNSEFDIFGGMDFPEQKAFPMELAITTTTTPSLPPILKDEFKPIDEVEFGAEFLKTVTPSTTDVDEMLLNPISYGYTTTRVPMSTYGEITERPQIDPIFLTTTQEPRNFAKTYNKQMEILNAGVFSVAMLKLFEFAKFKEPPVLRRMAWGLGRLFERYTYDGKLDVFGQPTKHALRKSTEKIGNLRPDELRAYGVTLYNSMVHRREIFSQDVNSIVDYIDSLYLKEESNNVITSVEMLDQFKNQSRVPYRELESFVQSIFAPLHRLKDSPRGQILTESLNRGLRNHFYPIEYFHDTEHRRNNDLGKTKEDISVTKKMNHKKNTFKDINNKVNIKRRNIDLEVQGHGEFWQRKDAPDPGLLQVQADQFINSNVMRTKKYVNHRATTNKNAYHIMASINNLKTSNKYVNNMMSTNKLNVIEVNRSITSQLPATKGWTLSNIDVNKRLVRINKKDETMDPDRVLKMSSGSKKHHKRHKHTHKRLKHKLAKILRIIKQYKPSYKKSKRHHKHRKHKHVLRTNNNNNLNLHNGLRSESKIIINNVKQPTTPKDRRFQYKIPVTTFVPTNNFYDYTTQVYEVGRAKFDFRRSTRNDDNEAKVNIIRQPSTESDEEIPLKINLYRAMALTKGPNVINKNKKDFSDNLDSEAIINDGIVVEDNKKLFIDELSSENDEETLLRNRIFNYFRHKYAT